MKDSMEKGRPRRRWMDRVKGCLNVTGLTIQEPKECVKDRREVETYYRERRRRSRVKKVAWNSLSTA